MAGIEEYREAPGGNISGGQGIQKGTGNTQYNNWTQKSPLDPVALSRLNPHIAVARLQQLSHDELVDFFAGAKPDDVSKILGVFAEVDLDKVVATLGHIGYREATELIDAVGEGIIHEFLGDLPLAA